MGEIRVQGYRVRLERTGRDEFLLSLSRFRLFWKRFSLSRGVARALIVLLRKGEGALTAGNITIRASRLGVDTILSIPDKGTVQLAPEEALALTDMVEATLQEDRR